MDITVRVVNTIQSVFGTASVITANVPTYGSPWALALAAVKPLDLRPLPEATDQLLQEQLTAPLRMFDGEALLGMLQTTKMFRDRLAAETCVYTVEAPPVFFGRTT